MTRNLVERGGCVIDDREWVHVCTYMRYELSSTGNYMYEGPGVRGEKKMSKNWKNDRQLGYRETRSSDWAWNEEKWGPEHAGHCQLWQQIDAVEKLWRVRSMINKALLPPSLIIYLKATGALWCVLNTYLLKLSHILTQGPVYHRDRKSPKEMFFKKIKYSFIFVFHPPRSFFIELFMKLRHIKIYNYPTDIKRVQHSQPDP